MACPKTATFIATGALLLIGPMAITGCKKNAAATTPAPQNQATDDSTGKIPADDSARDPWLAPDIMPAMVKSFPPEVRILPTRFSARRGPMGNVDGTKWAGHDVPLSQIVRVAYRWSAGRIVFTDPEPTGGYDFIATLPQGACDALQQELQKQVGLVGQVETTNTDVLVLKVRSPNAWGLKPPVIGGHKDYTAYSNDLRTGGEFVCNNGPLSTDTEPFAGLQRFLENNFNMPVVDETGITGNFSIDLKWNDRGPHDSNHEGLKQALANQLGLELVPGQRSVEMLVVERAN